MSASAAAPYPCGEYPVALLDLPATVKQELVAYRAARDRQDHAAAAMKAIKRAFAAAAAARCRTSPHFAAVLVEGSECEKTVYNDVKGQLQYCDEALALLQAAPSLPPILRSVHSRALVSRSHAFMLKGRHTEAIVDAEQAAALAVTPWDEVRAYHMLVGLYGKMMGEQRLLPLYEAAAKLEAAVAACEAAGVPRTDEVLQNGTENLWSLKYDRAYREQDYEAALVYARKLRALAKQEGHVHGKHPMFMVGAEAETLARLGRVEEAMALVAPAADWVQSAQTTEGISMMATLYSCFGACVAAKQSALAHSFLRTAEATVKSARETLDLTDTASFSVLQQADGILAVMKARMAKLGDDAAGAAAHKRSAEELQKQQQGMCCAEGCTNSFQASGEKLLMCSACKKAWYCSAVCQKSDWKARHKAACASKA